MCLKPLHILDNVNFMLEMVMQSSIILCSILIAPQITKNLRSVSQFAKYNNAYFMFYLDGCVAKDLRPHQELLEGC